MNVIVRRLGLTVAAGLGAVTLGWLGSAAATWHRYGRTAIGGPSDPLLDRYMPTYEIVERHEVRVAAPAAITYRALRNMDLEQSPFVRAIFRGREIMLGADHPTARSPRGILAQTLALGWRVLVEEPGHEIVVGAVTRPWEANVTFRGIPPEEFAAFNEPSYVKIVWNLSVEPIDSARSIARTETRVTTTDARARKLFRRYWSVFSPGIVLIRYEGLRLVRSAAERHAKHAE